MWKNKDEIHLPIIQTDDQGVQWYSDHVAELHKDIIRQIILEELYKHNVIIKKEID